MKLLVLGLVLLLIFGCTQNTPDSNTNNGITGEEKDKKTEPEFWVISPVNGAEILPGDVEVLLETRDLQIVAPSGQKVAGQGHFKIYVDDKSYIQCAAKVCTIKDMQPGEHTIRVTVQNNDQSENLKISEKEIKITVSSIPQFQLIYPVDKGIINAGNLKVSVDLKNFDLIKPEENTKNKNNQGYIVLNLDGQERSCFSTICEINGITPGKHILRAALKNNDGSDYLHTETLEIVFTAKTG